MRIHEKIFKEYRSDRFGLVVGVNKGVAKVLLEYR